MKAKYWYFQKNPVPDQKKILGFGFPEKQKAGVLTPKTKPSQFLKIGTCLSLRRTQSDRGTSTSGQSHSVILAKKLLYLN